MKVNIANRVKPKHNQVILAWFNDSPWVYPETVIFKSIKSITDKVDEYDYNSVLYWASLETLELGRLIKVSQKENNEFT